MFEQETVLSSQLSTATSHAYSSYVTLCKSKSKTKAVVWQVFLAAGQALSDFSLQMAVITALPNWGNPQSSAGITAQQPSTRQPRLRDGGHNQNQAKPRYRKSLWANGDDFVLPHLSRRIPAFCSASQVGNSAEAFPTGGFKCIGFHADWNLTMIQLVFSLRTPRSGLYNSQGFICLWSENVKILPPLRFYSSTANGC